tara:strand:+ start:338 stop:667 length:330 start_codon:yes stop_codon:yes gene_type:complete
VGAHVPTLTRQNATTLWPPDPNNNYLYINRSPEKLATLLNKQDIKVELPNGKKAEATPENVAYFIYAAWNAFRMTAYYEWLTKWRFEISQLEGVPLIPQRQPGNRTLLL